MNKLRILLVEDDDNLGKLLCDYLIAKGFNCTLKVNGEEGYKTFIKNTFDFLILDVMMPIKDGLTLAKEIRGIDRNIPILFLSAKAQENDKLSGFQVGADDYITKPFSMQELLARISAISKRSNLNSVYNSNIFNIGIFTFDSDIQKLSLDGKHQKLTTKENELLLLLIKNKNQILDRNMTLKAIWGDDNYFNGRSMDVYITKLRKYLKKDTSLQIINIHGKGFKLLEIINS